MISQVLAVFAALQVGPHWDTMTKANETASICAVRNGVRLDDRRTSPDILVRASLAACYSELLDLQDAIRTNISIELPNVPLEQRNTLISETATKMQKRIEDLTIQAVLEQRVRAQNN